MLLHHLKIAFRNLRKYRTQNIISVIGLAVGFTCFAFSALWIRYEMSYDSFYPKVDRIYRVHIDSYKWTTLGTNASQIQESTPYPFVEWIKTNFPEIEDACGLSSSQIDKFPALYADYSFCKMFDLDIPEDFFIRGRTDRPAAVTDNNKGATEYIKENLNYDVQAFVPRRKANTNLPFELFLPVSLRLDERGLNSWGMAFFNTYILVRKGVDIQALKEKLDKVELPERENTSSFATFTRPPVSLVLTPLTQLRYNDPTGNAASDVRFNHIQIFAIAGLLVILCSLFNHLTLYVTRVKMRLRELALRKVNGATDWQIAATLYTDFLTVILLSLIVGFMLMALLLPTFKEYASIGNNNVNIYTELTLYAVMLIGCSLIVGGIPVLYSRKQVLNESIKGQGRPGSGNLFRKGSLLVQLAISLGLMFCSVVFIKQIRFLHQTDLGINRRNVVSVRAGGIALPPPYADRIKQVPGVIDALPISRDFKDMTSGSYSQSYEKDDGERGTVSVLLIQADPHFFDFFGVEIFEGEVFSTDNNFFYSAVFNETAKKALGENNPMFQRASGFARDFYLTPTIKAIPTQISYPPNPGGSDFSFFQTIAYRYEEGMRQQTKEAVTQWLHNEFPDNGDFSVYFTYMEDVFDEYFKSERALLTLLSVMTLACMLIAVFGVYSLTNLTCQQRRKEIAIRKINGAETVDIMNIFFKENLLMLGMGAIVAFPTGYLIMRRWLEGYVKQTSMDAWLYVLIFLIVFVVILFSIVSIVWKAANQNPARVVNSL